MTKDEKKAQAIQKINEIKEKREALPIVQARKRETKGFMDFIRTQGVLGLAVGLILGSSLSTMVRSLIDDVIMPPLGMLLGSAEGLKGLTVVINHTPSGEPVTIAYGIFLNDFVNFLIIALVVYIIVRLLKINKEDIKVKSKI